MNFYKIHIFLEQIIIDVEVRRADEHKIKNYKTFFVRPSITFHLTPQTKHQFEENVERDSAFVKINSLIKETDYFIFEMISNSHIGGDHFSKFIKNFQFIYFEIINYLIILLANFLMIANFYRGPYIPEQHYVITDEDKTRLYPDNFILAIIHICYLVIIIFLWFKFKLPLYLQHEIMETHNKKFIFTHGQSHEINKNLIRDFIDKDNISVFKIIREVNNDLSSWQLFKILSETVFFCREINILFATLILMIVYLITKSPLCLAIPILFVINISTLLFQIFYAIKIRWQQLALILLYTYLLTYFFSWIVILWLSPSMELDGTDINSVFIF